MTKISSKFGFVFFLACIMNALNVITWYLACLKIGQFETSDILAFSVLAAWTLYWGYILSTSYTVVNCISNIEVIYPILKLISMGKVGEYKILVQDIHSFKIIDPPRGFSKIKFEMLDGRIIQIRFDLGLFPSKKRKIVSFLETILKNQ